MPVVSNKTDIMQNRNCNRYRRKSKPGSRARQGLVQIPWAKSTVLSLRGGLGQIPWLRSTLHRTSQKTMLHPARWSSRAATSPQRSHQLAARGQNATRRSPNDTWTRSNQHNGRDDRFEIHEVPKLTARGRNSETGGDVVEPTHSPSIYNTLYTYILH